MKWPRAGAKLVEDKANGPAVIQELRHHVQGLIEVQPEGGKVARAHAVAAQVESENVYLPHPATALWVEDFLEEATVFPHGRHDDQVDAMTQALNRLRGTGMRAVVPESQFVVQPFEIPDWPRAYGMAVTPNAVAVLWGARADDGTLYIHAEHVFSHVDPLQDIRAVRKLGEWVPGVVDVSRLKGSQADRERMVQLYREEGLHIQNIVQAEEAGAYQLQQMLSLRRVKVFASLSRFLEEYRTGDEQSPLLLCCYALILDGCQRMRSRPVARMRPVPEFFEHSYLPLGPGSWMV